MRRTQTSKRNSALEGEKLISEINYFKRSNRWFNSNALVAILSATIIGISLFLTFRADADLKKERLDQKEKDIIKRERELDVRITEFKLYELNEKKDSMSLSVSHLNDSLNFLYEGITSLKHQKNELIGENSVLGQKLIYSLSELSYAPIETEIEKIENLKDGSEYTITELIPENIKTNSDLSGRIINDLKTRLLKPNNFASTCVGLYYLAKGTNDGKWKNSLVDSIFSKVEFYRDKDTVINSWFLRLLELDIWTKNDQLSILGWLLPSATSESKFRDNAYESLYEAMRIYYKDVSLVKLNPKLYFKYIDINLTEINVDNFSPRPDYIYTLFYLSPQTLAALFVKLFYENISFFSGTDIDVVKIANNKKIVYSSLILSQILPYSTYGNIKKILKNFSVDSYMNNIDDLKKLNTSKVLSYLETDKLIFEKWLNESHDDYIKNPELLYQIIKKDSI